MLLGVLTRHLNKHEMLFTKPEAPYLGYSWEAVKHVVMDIREPMFWCSGGNSDEGLYHAGHPCKLGDLFGKAIHTGEKYFEKGKHKYRIPSQQKRCVFWR